jgi:uncharacterized protein YjbI with pentapeptide repeats
MDADQSMNPVENHKFTDAKEIASPLADFSKCVFANCDVSGWHFSGILDSCIFQDCNLSLTSFLEAKLQRVTFKNCKLAGVDFTL